MDALHKHFTAPRASWPPITSAPLCRVYWGSHGCCRERGHEGPHVCECAPADILDRQPVAVTAEESDDGNVGAPPYYGPNTTFYGEDA